MDVPGVGQSDDGAHADAVSRLCSPRGGRARRPPLDRVDVLGVSWGGALAQEFAWRYPAHVRRLVLAATTYGMPSVPGIPADALGAGHTRRCMSRSYFEKVAPALSAA